MSSFGAAPNVAFYYGVNPPWEELQAYDIVVVEPGHALDGARASTPRMQVFAYLSVGEVQFDRPYAKDLPQGLVGGANDPWRSHVVDQTHPEWPRFFVDRIVAPLWQAGYRGFFLDTMDSFQLISKDDETRARQAQGLVSAIRAMRARYPQAKLIFNRGFEVLPELYREAYAVAAESVYRGWDQKNRQYREVPEADRAWLLGQLLRVRDEYQLPVIAIEYAPPGDRELARDTARKIALLGFVPWVANAELDQLGVGNVEVTPRRVLVLHDASSRDAAFYAKRTHVLAKATLVDLGYSVDYADVNNLPPYPLVGRYVGIVSWFSDDQAILRPGVREWITRQREHGMRMVVLGSFPFPLTDALAVSFGLSAGPVRAPRTVRIEVRDPVIGQEAQSIAERALFTPLRAYKASTTLLRLRSDSGETMDAAALMPWGGYVLTPYDSEPVGGPAGDRWLIQPAEFMRRALAAPGAAVTDGSSDALKIRWAYIENAGSPIARAVPGDVTRNELKKNASERHSTTCCAS